MPDRLAPMLIAALERGGPLELRQAAMAALAAGRNLDPAGAATLLEGDPELLRELARLAAAPPGQAAESALALARRLDSLVRARQCLGCATCCRTSSPTLYAQDLELVGGPGLTRADLVALRAGERAFSARLGRGLALESELIKLRWGAGGACRNLAGNRCAIHPRRPLQCRNLECWSGRHAGGLEGLPRLGRAAIYAQDPTALALIAEYEVKLPAAAIMAALERAAQGGDQAPALGMLELDLRLRAGVSARYGHPAQELDLLLGRGVADLARGFGLALAADGEGGPRLAAAP